MRGVILAAGRGSRLGALTEERPKALVQLGDVPLLAFQLSALRGAGVSEIAVVTGYCADAITTPVSRRFHNDRWASTNMVRSLEYAADWLAESPCIVSYADIIYSSDAVTRLMDTDADLAISYDPRWKALWEERFGDAAIDAETFRFDARTSTLLDIGGGVTNVDQVEGQYMGLLRFTPASWRWIAGLLGGMSPADVDRLDVTRMLSALLRLGHPIRVAPIGDGWMEVDSESDLELGQRMLASGHLPLPS